MALPERHVVLAWIGESVVDRAGTEIGVCTAVFHTGTDLPEWMGVSFAGRTVLVPVLHAAESGGRVRVAVSRSDVAASPSAGDAGQLSENEGVALYRHYGMEQAPPPAASSWPASPRRLPWRCPPVRPPACGVDGRTGCTTYRGGVIANGGCGRGAGLGPGRPGQARSSAVVAGSGGRRGPRGAPRAASPEAACVPRPPCRATRPGP